jgi:hypothetical protein
MAFVTTKVKGYSLSVEYKNGVVSIKNNTALNNLLKNESNGSGYAAATIKAEYKKRMGKELDIEVGSLQIEILGHVYPDRIGNAIKKIWLPGFIEDAVDKILVRTEVIDCGEKARDDNRFFWDFLDKTARSLIIM